MSHREEMVKAIVARIFPGREPARCLEKDLCGNYLCQKLGECSVEQKSDNQLGYVLTAKSTNVFLRACPGSGKTEVVGLKAAYEFQAWQARHCGIAILTFTNNAADVIRERVEQYAGIKKSGHPHFVGTMDSWLHGYLAQPFGHLRTGYQGKENDNSIRVVQESDGKGNDGTLQPGTGRKRTRGWIEKYAWKWGYCFLNKQGKSQRIPLHATDIRYNFEFGTWEVRDPRSDNNKYDAIELYYQSDGFKQYVEDWGEPKAGDQLLEVKKRFLRDGYATYYDIEGLCYRLLVKDAVLRKRLASRFPFIIVDECQDLSWIQLQILGLLSEAGTALHLVGDLDQSIYEFKQVAPEKIDAFISSKALVEQNLTDNFRSCQQIVDVCGRLVCSRRSSEDALPPAVQGKESPPNGPACVYVLYDKKKLSTLPAWFEAYLKQREIEVASSAILARGRHSTVNALRGIQNRQAEGRLFALAMSLHLWSRDDLSVRQDALEQMGRFMVSVYFNERHATKLRYYCPESVSSPMQWRIWLARVLDGILESQSNLKDLAQTWSSWAKCVGEQFGEVVERYWPLLATTKQKNSSRSNGSDNKSFRAPSGFASKKVVDCLTTGKAQEHQIKITTIHSVKGETFDAILLVSSPNKGKGGHWSEWLKESTDEHARFAYVASSRPKKLLAWAIPIGKERSADSKRIADLGFKMLPPVE